MNALLDAAPLIVIFTYLSICFVAAYKKQRERYRVSARAFNQRELW